MDRQAVCDVLNSFEVVESDADYMLVKDTPENRVKLIDVGITEERINAVSSDGTFCIFALAFYDDKPIADDYMEGKFVVYGGYDEQLRELLLSRGATPEEAEDLLSEGGIAYKIGQRDGMTYMLAKILNEKGLDIREATPETIEIAKQYGVEHLLQE